MPDERQIQNQVRQSVQTEPPPYMGLTWFRDVYGGSYSTALPPIWDMRRQAYLDVLDRHPQNALWQGASRNLIKKIAYASYEISGKRRVKHYQAVINNANKGRGYAHFVQQFLRNYLVYDDGAVIEMIGRGPADKYLPRELITGINVLDTRYCHFTGNTEFPVFYQDARTGKLHKMHRSRVYREVDMPSSDPLVFGRGESSLSRATSWAQQFISNQTYVGESLDDNPPPGIMIAKAVIRAKWDEAMALYDASRNRSGDVRYKPWIEYIADPGEDPEVLMQRFAQAPEGYDPIKYIEADSRGIALALDIDPNEVWAIAGGTLGVNTLGKILDRKGKQGGLANLFKMMERFFNEFVLPDNLRLAYKNRDSEESEEAARLAKSHADVANAIAPYFPEEVVQRYLINSIDGLAAVALDANGQVIQRAYDDDPEEGPVEQTVADNAPVADDAPAGGGQIATDDTPIETGERQLGTKDFEDVRFGFTGDWYQALESMNDSYANRAGDKAILRGILSRRGKAMLIEGLKKGGVEVETLEGDDLAIHTNWLADQEQYLDGLLDRAYKGMSEPQIRASAESWANKSLTNVYTQGVASADRNGLYVFTGSDGEESCSDCQRLKGKKFRLKDWLASGYLPDDMDCRLECKGFRCEHYLQKTTGRANRKSILGLKGAA